LLLTFQGNREVLLLPETFPPLPQTEAFYYSTAAMIVSGGMPIHVIAESFLPISLSEWPQ